MKSKTAIKKISNFSHSIGTLHNDRRNYRILQLNISITYCVRKVNAAEVMEEGSRRPLMISCQSFLLMTSTRPPRAITRLQSSYRSNTDFAMMGSRFIGVPGNKEKVILIYKIKLNLYLVQSYTYTLCCSKIENL